MDDVEVRADELRSKRETLRVFAASGSARVLVGVLVLLATVRALLGAPGWGDVAVIVLTVIATGPVEWIIHRHLLHADEDAWTSRRLGTGVGHRRHHLDPPDVEWLMLRGVDAAVFVAAFGVLTLAWVAPLSAVLGVAVAPTFVTAWAMAALRLAHYEWIHLLVHTRYRPRTAFYARLASNHRLHHYRNERYWLGVTTNSGDRLLRTLPAQRSDVPLSDTARTLEPA